MVLMGRYVLSDQVLFFLVVWFVLMVVNVASRHAYSPFNMAAVARQLMGLY